MSADLAQTEAGIVEALQKTVSPSRLSLFLQCRLKFWFKYVLQLQKPRGAALHVGSSVHTTLKAWNKARWRKQSLTTEQVEAAYLQAWLDQDRTAVVWGLEEEDKQQKAGWALVEMYLRESRLPLDVLPEGVEVPVEADLSSHGLPLLVGVLDLVQSGFIVDYKTSASTPNPEQVAHVHGAQISSYAILYRETKGKQENGIEIHTLVKLKTPKLVVTTLPPIDVGQETRLFHLIESYVAGLARRDWVPSPGFQCAWCEFFDECRSWR